ncbi:MAG: multicopper oxidase domain-containing protein, partial [Parvularculaceae bacterium]
MRNWSRRNVIAASAAFSGGLVAQGLLAPWARSAVPARRAEALSGATFNLVVDRARALVDGRGGAAILVNGALPAPLLRWREGDEITLNVTNRLDEDTSIHWH